MNKLFISLVIIQVLLGMILPLGLMISIKLFRFNDELRKLLYFVSVILLQVGIFSTRWNVVLSGQMFSKSFSGLTTYKMELTGMERLIMTLVLLIMPLVVLALLVKVRPPWGETWEGETS